MDIKIGSLALVNFRGDINPFFIQNNSKKVQDKLCDSFCCKKNTPMCSKIKIYSPGQNT